MASRAVIIGPARYAEDSGIPSHDEIGRSAHWYGEVLKGDRRWGEGQVEVVPEDRLGSINDVMDAVQKAADEADDTLLVIYVGHGAYWEDVPGAQVHFAVGSSRNRAPYTWLSSWYVYRAMRRSAASSKVLIADCCYSNLLPQLGDPRDGALRGALAEVHKGTCVLTAVKNVPQASATGCKSEKLPVQFRECTPFSGHLLNVLQRGTRDSDDDLTLGMIRDAVSRDMESCDTDHDSPRMILNDARERMPLFSNRMDLARRQRSDVRLSTVEEWVAAIMAEGSYELDQLLADPGKTGEVVARLSRDHDEAGRLVALRVNERANKFFGEPDLFARYWAKAARALLPA